MAAHTRADYGHRGHPPSNRARHRSPYSVQEIQRSVAIGFCCNRSANITTTLGLTPMLQSQR